MVTNAYIGAGIAQGLGQAYQYNREYETRQAQRETAKNEQALSSLKLNEYMQNAPMRKSEAEAQLQLVQSQAYTANSQVLKEQTYNAFRNFSSDGNVRHLNEFLKVAKTNPAGSRTYADVVRYDPVTRSSETDKLLRQAGYTDLEGIYNDPNLTKDLVIATNTKGERILVPMEQVYASTGYTKVMKDEELAEMERKARIQQMLRSGQSTASVSLKEQLVKDIMNTKNVSLAEAYAEVVKLEEGQGASSEERMINSIAEQEGISQLEAAQKFYSTKQQGKGETDQSRFIDDYMRQNPGSSFSDASAAYANRTATTKQKETATIDADKDALDEIGFLDMDLSEMSSTQKAQIHRHISNIERITGSELSNEDKRVLRDTRSLITLGGDVTTKLTPEETGLLDKTLNHFKSYIVDEVGGKEATAAYETFRNVLRNVLYGASITDTESAAFDAAVGSLGEKFKPVMARFKVQMEQLRDTLSSVRDMNDPYIAHYYVGGSVDKVDDIIRAIDQRIANVNKRNTLTVRPTPVESPAVPDGTPPRASLSELYERYNK